MRLKFKVAANTLVQILGKLISSGSTFLITILIARRFGVKGFGEFVKITTYVSLFYLIVDFGLNAVSLKEYQKLKIKYQNDADEKVGHARSKHRHKSKIKNENQEAKIIFSNLLGLRIVFALVLIFIALGILVFLPFNPLTLEGFTPVSKLGIIILLPTILTQAIFVSANAVFQKRLRYDLSVLASSLGSLVTLGFVYLLIKTNAFLLLMVGSYLIGGLVMAGIAFYFSRSFFSPLRKRAFAHSWSVSTASGQFSIWKRLLLKSFPLSLTLVFNLIYFKADTLILTVFRSTKEVGVYGLARSFFEFPLAIPTFFMNTIYPALITRAQEHENTRTKRLVKKSAGFLILSSLLLSVICYLLSSHLILIKSDFAPSVTVFRILVLGLPIFFISSLFMWTLIAFGKQKLLALIYGNVMIINVLLNLFFIPRYGPCAAAIILIISELIVLILTGSFCLDVLKKMIK